MHSESSPFIMPVGEVALTQLQEAILSAIQVLHTVSKSQSLVNQVGGTQEAQGDSPPRQLMQVDVKKRMIRPKVDA